MNVSSERERPPHDRVDSWCKFFFHNIVALQNEFHATKMLQRRRLRREEDDGQVSEPSGVKLFCF